MAIQRPIFSSIAEQQARIKKIQLDVLFPYSYRLNRLVSTALFSIADTNVPGAFYDSFGFVAPETMQISAIRASCLTQIPNTHSYAWCLSFADLFTMGDSNSSGVPDDQGNDIYRSLFYGNEQLDDFFFFDESKGFYLTTGQTLFFYQWADAAAIAAGNINMIGSLTLYTIPTGQRT